MQQEQREHRQLWFEFILLFVMLPLSFMIPYVLIIKVLFVIMGFVYVLWRSKTLGLLEFSIPDRSAWIGLFRSMIPKLLLLILCSVLYVYWKQPEAMFRVLLQKPLMWFGILVVYTVLSSWPQEFVYRRFYVARYAPLFVSDWALYLSNATVFALAHAFFGSGLVLCMTFVGSILFLHTYKRFSATALVTIEHALYGNWLFTVGMGDLLAFPQ